MFGLFGNKEFKYIVNDEQGVFARAYQVYTKRPGFFTPYSCLKHFCGGLIAPVVYPIMNSLLVIGAVFTAAAALLGSIVLLLLTGGAFLFSTPEMFDECLMFTKECLELLAAATMFTAIHGFLAAASVPHSLLSLVTRSIATLISLDSETQFDDQEPLENSGFLHDALY